MAQSLSWFARQSYRFVKRRLRPNLHRPDQAADYVFLGSQYGGWPVLRDSLGSSSLVYAFGVGDDISFDIALIETFGCRVKAFDPTPRCRAWVEKRQTPENFEFFPVGLSDKSQILSFSAPENDGYMSYTVGQQPSATELVRLPVKSLDEILAERGDTVEAVDLLKLDIEGSEYDALPDMIAKRLLPKQLCVEFHHGMFGFTDDDTIKAVNDLRIAGYELYFVSDSGREYGFFR